MINNVLLKILKGFILVRCSESKGAVRLGIELCQKNEYNSVFQLKVTTLQIDVRVNVLKFISKDT